MTHTATPAITDVARQLGALKTRWRESGDGSSGTVLMLHSIGLDRLAFDPLRHVLPNTWRLVSFDLPGHGAAVDVTGYDWEQCVAVVCEAMDACGVNRLHLLGHSMGGALAAEAAARTKTICSLALLATPPKGLPVFIARANDTRNHGVAAQVAETMPRWFGTNPIDVDGDVIGYASASLRSMQPAGLAMAWDALSAFAGYQHIGKNLPRVLLMAGAADLSTPPAAMQNIAEQLLPEYMRMDVVDSAGHMFPLTHAKQIASTLTAHWGAGQV